MCGQCASHKSFKVGRDSDMHLKSLFQSGKHFNWHRRLHPIISTAFHILHFRQFIASHPVPQAVTELLSHINGSVIEGIALDSISYLDGVINIVGRSLSDQNIIEFNSKLDKSPLIRRASLQTMSVSTIDGVTVKNFSLSCSLAPLTEQQNE